jgi:hypothetical protein
MNDLTKEMVRCGQLLLELRRDAHATPEVEDAVRVLVDWINDELAQPIDRPETGHDLVNASERLRTAKQLGALLAELNKKEG